MNPWKQGGSLSQLKKLRPSTKNTEVINVILRLWKGIDMREGFETYTEMKELAHFMPALLHRIDSSDR
jgi:hypothetical protein